MDYARCSDYIIREGEAGTDMYFIRKGLAYVSGSVRPHALTALTDCPNLPLVVS